MGTFPTSTPSYLGFTATHTLAADTHAAQHNQEQADIIALANKVGTGASTPATNQVLTGNGVGTSSWSQVNLTTMVSGILPVANGGTGTTSTTGTGSVVYATSPTTTNETLAGQPTISDFTNANHTHISNAQGGTLNAANALQANSVSFANLLSTIFSGQVQTQANAGTAGGTMWYINLGGIKLCWGTTASQASHNSPTYGVTLPTGFFSTFQFLVSNTISMGTDGNQVSSILSNAPPASFIINFYSPNNSVGANQISAWLVIGT